MDSSTTSSLWSSQTTTSRSSQSTSSTRSTTTSVSSVSTSTAASETSSSETSQYDWIDLRAEIVAGIGGDIVHDSHGGQNAMRVDLSRVGPAGEPFGMSFRLPPSVSQPVYLRFRTGTPLPAGYSIFLDEVAVVAGTELYPGGPIAAAFTGRERSVVGDNFEILVQHDRRGQLQEWFQRLFDLTDLDLLLPTAAQICEGQQFAAMGQNLIPDSVITAGPEL